MTPPDDYWRRERDHKRRTKLEKRRDGSAVAVPLGAPITMHVSLAKGQQLERAHLRYVDDGNRSRWSAESTLTTPAPEHLAKYAGADVTGVAFDVAADDEEHLEASVGYEFSYTLREADGTRFTVMTSGLVDNGVPGNLRPSLCAFFGEFSDLERRAFFPAAALVAGECGALVQRTAAGISITKCGAAPVAAPTDSPPPAAA